MTVLEETEIIDLAENVDDFEQEMEDIISEDQKRDKQPPFDPTKIRVKTRNPTISLILERIKLGELNLEPDFQRSPDIWSKEAQSRLIESILVRIPLPSFYIDASDDNQWLIVDGLQRLSTLKSFVLDKTLKLAGLDYLTELEGKSYDDLERPFKRRILETEITVNSIEYDTSENTKYHIFHIFKRINTGGLPLSVQEIRHVIYQGKATELLKKLSESLDFKKNLGINNNDKKNKLVIRMGDKEFILRFLAFYITPYSEYTESSLEDFLNKAMEKINKASDSDIFIYESNFNLAMKTAKNIFGDLAFRKLSKTKSGNYRKYPPNKALFEIWSVNFTKLTNEELNRLVEKKKEVIDRFLSLVDYQGNIQEKKEECQKFNTAITYGTSQVQRVRYRFTCIDNLIQEILL